MTNSCVDFDYSAVQTTKLKFCRLCCQIADACRDDPTNLGRLCHSDLGYLKSNHARTNDATQNKSTRFIFQYNLDQIKFQNETMMQTDGYPVELYF